MSRRPDLNDGSRRKMTNPVRLRLIPYNARLIDARKARRWTQKYLSLLTGISSSQIGHIETLRTIPSQQARDEICSALELSEDYLFPTSLMEALRDGSFGHRVVELEENQLQQLPRSRPPLLSPMITQDETLEVEMTLDLKKEFADVLSGLTARERKVLSLRYGLGGDSPKTLEEVGRAFDRTRETIRVIEAKALRKLRHPSRSRRLKDYLR